MSRSDSARIFSVLGHFFVAQNPKWTEDRKNYDQVTPCTEKSRKNIDKTMSKVHPNYKQGGQKIRFFLS